MVAIAVPSFAQSAPRPAYPSAPPPAYPRYAPQDGVGKTYFAVKMGAIIPKHDDVSGYDNGFALEGAIGYRVNRNVALEVSVGRFSMGFEESGYLYDDYGYSYAAKYTDEVVAYPVLGTARFIAPVDAIEVYGLVGAGMYIMSDDVELKIEGLLPETDSDSDTPFALHVGGGMNFRVSPRAVLGAEVKYIIGKAEMYDVTSNFNSVLFGAFLGFQL